MKSLVEARKKLAALVEGCSGWLAFFYTNAFHQIVAIRFRKPYDKQILFFKPTSIGGVFNHGLFAPYDSPRLKPFNDFLIVVEGEFNQLQLQSLCARMSEKEGRPPESGYINACAVGGVHNTDVETIRRLAKKPVVCYDHDTSGAGFALVGRIQQVLTVSAFTTPKPDSDLDDFIRSFGSDIDRADGAIKQLVSDRETFTRPFAVIKEAIDRIRRSEGGTRGLKRFEVNRRAGEIIVKDVSERGRFYHDGRQSYVFLDIEKRLIPVERDNSEIELALTRYGIAPGEELFRHILDAIRLHGLENGIHSEVYPFSHYDRRSATLYLFDFDHRVYRITPGGTDCVDNGADGVLFLKSSHWKPFELLGEPNPTHSAFDELILSPIRFREEGLGVGDRRLLFLLWFYSLFFPDLFPTRPIVALIGEKGSGKTHTLRRVGQLLFGPSFNVMQLSNDPKDFDAAVTHEPFVAVDNSDTKVPWLDDRLAVVATGGTIKRRDLYTTNRLVEYPVRAFLGITSRTPRFRREDVADRLLLFYLSRFETFTPESTLLEELQERRNEVLTEVVGHLQEIVRALDGQRDKTYPTRLRMADFADFSLRVAHAQGWNDRMHCILERLVGEQSSFVAEGEPIFDLLELWLAKDGGRNVGREITATALCQELTDVAETHGMEFWYRGKGRSFAQRLRNLMGSLREFFEIRERTGKGRSRFLSFRPKSERSQTAATHVEEERDHHAV